MVINKKTIAQESLGDAKKIKEYASMPKDEVFMAAVESGMVLMATLFQYSFNDDGNLVDTNKEVVQIERE